MPSRVDFSLLSGAPGRRRVAPMMSGALAVGLLTITLVVALSSAADAAPAGPTTYGIFAGQTPDRTSASDPNAVELGVKFYASSPGWITGVRFYKGADNVGNHVGRLWTQNGTQIARTTFDDESATGWQTAYFDEPVEIKSYTQYVASYFAPNGHYAIETAALSWAQPAVNMSLTAVQGVFTYAKSFPNNVWHDSNYYVDPIFTTIDPDAAPTSPPTTSTPPPSTTTTTMPPPPTTTTTTPPPPTSTTTTPPPNEEFPSATTTGVPAGTALSAYTGPMTITIPNTVIDAKTVNGNLNIRTTGVRITRSKINGTVATDDNSTGYSFTISDSEVNVGNGYGTGIGAVDFVATRVHVYGGNRSINCYRNCTVQDSYVHGQFTDITGQAHESGIRMGQDSVIRHNTISCDAPDIPPDAGCSADLTGYGDFGPVQNNLIENNFFVAGTGGYCAYGGSSPGKPYSSQTNHIVFKDNVWEVGDNPARPSCYYGPITAFDTKAPGNQWVNNKFDNGKTVNAAN